MSVSFNTQDCSEVTVKWKRPLIFLLFFCLHIKDAFSHKETTNRLKEEEPNLLGWRKDYLPPCNAFHLPENCRIALVLTEHSSASPYLANKTSS